MTITVSALAKPSCPTGTEYAQLNSNKCPASFYTVPVPGGQNLANGYGCCKRATGAKWRVMCNGQQAFVHEYKPSYVMSGCTLEQDL